MIVGVGKYRQPGLLYNLRARYSAGSACGKDHAARTLVARTAQFSVLQVVYGVTCQSAAAKLN